MFWRQRKPQKFVSQFRHVIAREVSTVIQLIVEKVVVHNASLL